MGSLTLSQIEWDTDGATPADLDLPSEVTVDAAVEGIDSHDAAADWLSDKYGWAVNGFVADPAFEETPSPKI